MRGQEGGEGGGCLQCIVSTSLSSPRAIPPFPILRAQTTKQELNKTRKGLCAMYGRNELDAEMLDGSPTGVGTVLRSESHA